MKNTFQSERNQQIYNEYINSDSSFNTLARKYEVTPQRIAAIVKDFKNKGLGQNLKNTDPKENREQYKNNAVELREKGNYEISISLFEQIMAWDKANNNLRGLNDVIGHTVIAYNKLAQKATTPEAKKQFFEKSKDLLTQSLDIIKTAKLPTGPANITKTHLASTNFNLAMNTEDKKQRKQHLEQALDAVEQALTDFPGSQAHKAWPLKIKAQILHAQGKTDEAFEALILAEKFLYIGYPEEMGWAENRKDVKTIGNDQARLKILKWLNMLHLLYAQICAETNRKILAEHYLNSVITMHDPEGFLAENKKEAKKLLKTL